MNRFSSLMVFFSFLLSFATSSRATLLQGEIVDSKTGAALAGRIYVQAEGGRFFFVQSAAREGSAVTYEKRNWINTNSVEIHTTVSAHPFKVELPPGRYQIIAERGKEYEPSTNSVTVGDAPVSIRLPLKRWINMSERKWFSGDVHVHRTIDELRNQVPAEDLNVAFPLTYWVTKAFTPPSAGDKNIADGAAAELISLDAEHVIWPRNTEYEIFTVDGKQHTLGAIFVLGHKSILTNGVPPVGPMVEIAKKEGALLDLDKHDWPWAMTLPVSAGVQLYELANNHIWRTEFGMTNWASIKAPYLRPPYGGPIVTERQWIQFTQGNYYTLLNAGFDMKPSGGTANGVHPVPLGFGRVYVHLPEGFYYDRWFKGLGRGHSFVTTGPMVFATVNERDPGERFQVGGSSEKYRLAGTVVSEQPLSFIEVIRNGLPDRTFMGRNTRTPDGAYETAFTTEYQFEETSWILVRCWEDREGGRVRYASTAPWHFTVAGKPLRPRKEEKEFLISRVKEQIERSARTLPEKMLTEYHTALERYEGLETQDDSAEVKRQARTLKSDGELRFWLENMMIHHRFTLEEIRAVTGFTLDQIRSEAGRLGVNATNRPVRSEEAPLRVLPYPGGRHPRTGFLDGALEPQRETKISVFTPWNNSSYVVADVPEAVWSNLGLTYLAHTHVPTVWSKDGKELERMEWKRNEDGTLEFERKLPNGISFGTRVMPSKEAVRMEMWLHNGTAGKLSDLRIQNCVMLKGAEGFDAQSNQNKVLASPFAAVRSDQGNRWIITAWDHCHRPWANPPVPCIHADPKFPDCEPGEKKTIRGWLSFYEGTDIEAEFRRIEKLGWLEGK